LSIRETCRPRIDPHFNFLYAKRMAMKAAAKMEQASSLSPKSKKNETGRMPVPRPSSLLDTRVVYCGDNLEQLKKLPDDFVSLPVGWQSGSGMEANSVTFPARLFHRSSGGPDCVEQWHPRFLLWL
jgi:hypothetical protein